MEAQTKARPYRPHKGGQKAKVLARLRAASPQAVSRDELAALVGRASLKPLIFKMKQLSLIACSPQGYHLPGILPPAPVAEAVTAAPLAALSPFRPSAPDLPDHLRRLLAAILRRAHAFRLGGAGHEAARLLRQAAGAHGLDRMPHVRADLLALADLFAAHRTTYPELDLGRVA